MPVTNYLWDEDNIVLETDEADATLAEYTYEPEQYGNLISERRGGETYQHHYDVLGSARLLTDETGQITDTFAYDAWGNELTRTGETETPFRWIGELGYCFDLEAGQYAVRARDYDPAIARWRSVDPLHRGPRARGTLSDASPYVYAANSPLILDDPSGAKESCRCGIPLDANLIPAPPLNPCPRAGGQWMNRGTVIDCTFVCHTNPLCPFGSVERDVTVPVLMQSTGKEVKCTIRVVLLMVKCRVSILLLTNQAQLINEAQDGYYPYEIYGVENVSECCPRGIRPAISLIGREHIAFLVDPDSECIYTPVDDNR